MTHRIIRRAVVCAAALSSAVVALSSSTARAHGGIPRAFEILFEPGKPDHILLRSDIEGVFASKDNGKTWFWGCSELYKSQSLYADHRNMLIASGGRIVVAGGFNGLLVSDDLCSWHSSKTFSRALPDGGVDSELVQDVFQLNGSLIALTATGRGGLIDGKLWKSTDNGETWTVTGGPLPNDFAGSSLSIPASGAPMRIYVSGRRIDADGVVQRSDDGGMTWKTSPVPTKLDFAFIRIAQIHPTNPDIFFVWADLPEDIAQNNPDEIYGTKDGGKTFTLIYAGKGDLPGFALSPDNSEILIAGPLESIVAAKLDDAFAMGQSAFQPRLTGCPDNTPCQVWGLAWTSAGLYAGMNDFVTGGLTRATLGLSQDGGKSFTKIMDLCDAKFDAACGADTAMAMACLPVWNNVYAFDYTNGPRCMPNCTVDPSTNTCATTGAAAGAAGMSGATNVGTGASSNMGGVTSGAGGAGNATGASGAGTRGTIGNGGQTNTGGTPKGGDSGCSYAPTVRRPGLGVLVFVLGALGLLTRWRARST